MPQKYRKKAYYYSCKESRWVALSFLIELVEIWKKLLSKSVSEANEIKNKINLSIEYLKVGQMNSKPVMVIKELDIDFCKFLGAFATDGCLDRKWRINISDEDPKEIKKVCESFTNLFKLSPLMRKAKKGNWWEFEIYNKVIGRYLNVFFGFPIGKKSRTVNEPLMIRNSTFEFRKAFVAGVLNFDGSVTINGNITLESYSPLLINSVKEVLLLDKIETHKSPNGRVLQILNPSLKCLEYFEEESNKRKRLEIILGIRKELIINSTMKKVLNFIQKGKIFDAKRIAEGVGTGQNSIYAYMKIIKNCEIIKEIKDMLRILEYLRTSDGIFVILENNKREELFLSLKNQFSCNSFIKLSEKLKIPPTTVVRWSLGQNGIPIKTLLKFYEFLGWKLNINDIAFIRTKHNYKFYEVNLTSTTSPSGSVS